MKSRAGEPFCTFSCDYRNVHVQDLPIQKVPSEEVKIIELLTAIAT